LHVCDEVVYGDLAAAVRVVGFGVVASGAVVGTSLGEYDETESRAVYDGVLDGVMNAHGSDPPCVGMVSSIGKIGAIVKGDEVVVELSGTIYCLCEGLMMGEDAHETC